MSADDRADSSLRDGRSSFPFIIFTAIWGSTWIVIRGQLGTVPPQWSVTYRFVIAAGAMAMVAAWKRQSLKLGRKRLLAGVFLGFTQFCINFNAVYLAERHITSGVVATVFALAADPRELARLGVARPQAQPPLRVELAGRGRRHRPAVRP